MLAELKALDTALCVLVVVAGNDGTFFTYNLALQVRIEMRLDAKRHDLTRRARTTSFGIWGIHWTRT